MQDIHKLNITVSKNNPEEDIKEIIKIIKPDWNIIENIEFQTFSDGTTNSLIGIFQKQYPNNKIIIRIYGNNTHLLIDRNAEKINFKTLYKNKLAPKLYAEFNNGLVYDYVKGVTTDVNSIRDINIYKLVAKNFANLHKMKLDNNNLNTEFWIKLKNWFNLIPEKFNNQEKQNRFNEIFTGGKKELQLHIDDMENMLLKSDSPLVFCHNDLMLRNIIYNQEEAKVTFIDYEYGFINYQAFDIANHFNEFSGNDPVDHSFYPNDEFQLSWLRLYLEEYLEKSPTDQQISALHHQVIQFCPLAHLFWTIWGLVQAENSDIDFDFFNYVKHIYDGFHMKKEKCLSLKA